MHDARPQVHRCSRRRHASRIAAAVGLTAACAVAAAAPAQAHDALVGTTPSSGAAVTTTPSTVMLRFEEPPLKIGLGVVVIGPDGPVQTGSPVLAASTVTQRIAPRSPAGRYTVTWRVTADDGHPVGGTFSFTSSAAGADPAATAVAATSSPGATASGAASGTTTPAKPQTSPLLGAAVIALAAIGGIGGSRWLRNRRRERQEDVAP